MKKFGNMTCYFKLSKCQYSRVSKNWNGCNKRDRWKLLLCLKRGGGGSSAQNKENRVGGDHHFACCFEESQKANLQKDVPYC